MDDPLPPLPPSPEEATAAVAASPAQSPLPGAAGTAEPSHSDVPSPAHVKIDEANAVDSDFGNDGDDDDDDGAEHDVEVESVEDIKARMMKLRVVDMRQMVSTGVCF